jgi:mono/diheme cytochrome c family protein
MQSRVPRCLWALLGALVMAACAVDRTSDPAGFAATLPAGEGREILVGECLNCHELSALALFEDFYDEGRWRSLVITMRGNGAELDDRQVDVLAEYLALNFGTGLD